MLAFTLKTYTKAKKEYVEKHILWKWKPRHQGTLYLDKTDVKSTTVTHKVANISRWDSLGVTFGPVHHILNRSLEKQNSDWFFLDNWNTICYLEKLMPAFRIVPQILTVDGGLSVPPLGKIKHLVKLIPLGPFLMSEKLSTQGIFGDLSSLSF